MEQVKLTKVFRSMKKKDGTPNKTKDGKPYERVAIKTATHGDKWISGFGNSMTDQWNEGDTVSIVVETKDVNGQQYLNFSVPRKEDLLEQRVAVLEEKVQTLEENAQLVDVESKPKADVPPEEEEIDVSQIPF